MKYEEIKIGDVFTFQDDKETVISKNDKYRFIVTIDSEETPTAWEEDELYMLEPIKEELPEEGLLVSGKGSLVYKLSDGLGYGFTFGNQTNYSNDGWNFSNVGYWRKATKQEEEKFIEMLKTECEKRGLFEDTKIEKHADGRSLVYPDDMRATSRFSSIYGYNKNGQIFYKGKFATPIKDEEPTLELVSKAYLDLSKFGVEIKQEGNMLIIKPIKKT